MFTLLMTLLTAAPATVPVKVELRYTLANGAPMKCIGTGCPDTKNPSTMTQTWFFLVPANKADKASMNEVLHRVFFDSNAAMRAAEPGDTGYMKLVDFKHEKFDEKSMLAAKRIDDLPWKKAADSVVWEPSCCYLVDDKGNWDTLKWSELTQLFAFRLMDRKALDEKGFLAFWRALSNDDSGRKILEEKDSRTKALTAVRENASRRKPGSKPIVSWSDEAK
ncbi:MAG: hypothetical protein DI536_24420 [Archangium gephyra]|uniref:Uncharacterized protein n=1 Tax=Archangium gephyra TaxID=48 RepID=A0A2W5VER6_9BACT|nr:MAG: hypothetical protein DI536_24420 [Archangium gephyra]